MRPDRTKGFANIQAEWYSKLFQLGFKDIEKDGKLKDYHSTNWNNPEQAFRSLVAKEYIEAAESVYKAHKFRSPKEKLVWLWHCKGKSSRDIVKLWNKLFLQRVGKSTVNDILNRICKETGLKYEQGNRKAG